MKNIILLLLLMTSQSILADNSESTANEPSDNDESYQMVCVDAEEGKQSCTILATTSVTNSSSNHPLLGPYGS